MSARQKNTPKGGENFKLSPAGKPAMGGKGGSMSVVGPKSATRSISGLSLGPAEHKGPAGAPYINANSYGGDHRNNGSPNPTNTKNR